MSSCAAESEVDITGVVAAEEEDGEIDAKATDGWHIFGRECPKEEIVFLCQVIILYTVIVVSIYNLTVAHDDSTLWTALLSSSLGYLLPNPSLKRQPDSVRRLLSRAAQQCVDDYAPEQHVGAVHHQPTASHKSLR